MLKKEASRWERIAVAGFISADVAKLRAREVLIRVGSGETGFASRKNCNACKRGSGCGRTGIADRSAPRCDDGSRQDIASMGTSCRTGRWRSPVVDDHQERIGHR